MPVFKKPEVDVKPLKQCAHRDRSGVRCRHVVHPCYGDSDFCEDCHAESYDRYDGRDRSVNTLYDRPYSVVDARSPRKDDESRCRVIRKPIDEEQRYPRWMVDAA